MANTTGEVKTEFLVRMQASTTMAFYTDTILDDSLDTAHKWAAAYRKWPFTEARISTTYTADNTDIEVGFNYPESWKPDSIRYLTVGGKRFKKKNFYKYLEFREDNSSSQSKIFTDHGLLYFINPQADVSGTTALWGQYTPADLDRTDTGALTVFSNNGEEGNEAIIFEMMSHAFYREKKPQEALSAHQRAMAVLEELWKRVADEQFGYHDVDGDGMFGRFDVISGTPTENMFKRDRWF